MVPRAQTIGAVFRPALNRGAGWEGFAAGVARAALWLALPVLLLQVIDRALPASRPDDLIPLAVAVTVAFAARHLLDLAVAATAEAGLHAAARRRIWTAISEMLVSGGATPPSPDVPEIRGAFPMPVSRLAGLPVLAAALIYFGGAMALLPVLLALIAAATAYFGARDGAGPSGAAPADGIAESILDAIWTIKAMGAENLVLRRAEKAAAAQAAEGRARTRLTAVSERRVILFDRLTLVAAVLTGTVLCLNGLITAGQLAAGVLIAGTLVRDAYRGTEGWVRARSGDTVADLPPPEVPAEPLPGIAGNLMLNRVSFEEPADGLRAVSRLLFDRIRIEIDAGEAVLISGGDMPMQTALLRLMAGLERPQSGTVSVDAFDLAAYRPDSVRRRIVYVPPVGDLLPGTIMDNLTGFDPGRTADALGAARLTGLDIKAAGLTDGLETRLQAGAAGFPAGFRQHVAVTRALAFKPKVLLLDHATENLDSEHLRVFSEVLERLKGRVTIVYASSQAGLRAMADREIDLDELKPAPEIGAATDAGDADGSGEAPPSGGEADQIPDGES